MFSLWFPSKSLVLISALLSSCYMSWFYDPNKRQWKVQGVKIISMQFTILPIFHLRFKCSPYCCVLIDPWFLYLYVATWTSHWHVTRGPEAVGRGGNDNGSELWQMPHWSSALPACGEDFPAESAFTFLHGWGKSCICHNHRQAYWCCGTQRGKALHSFGTKFRNILLLCLMCSLFSAPESNWECKLRKYFITPASTNNFNTSTRFRDKERLVHRKWPPQ